MEMPVIKRILDFCAVLAISITGLPVLVAICLLVRINMGSPVLFRQERPGLHGRPFVIYKFRTMRDDLDEQGNLLPDDQRLTRLGRLLRSTSLDELPELWNVLKGNMSLVGPRPLMTEYLDRYTPEQYRRHEMKPGITGWAQVNGRNSLTWEEKFKLDVWYVNNWNLFLDIKILWLTLWKVLLREGINAEGYATMPKFLDYEKHKYKA